MAKAPKTGEGEQPPKASVSDMSPREVRVLQEMRAALTSLNDLGDRLEAISDMVEPGGMLDRSETRALEVCSLVYHAAPAL